MEGGARTDMEGGGRGWWGQASSVCLSRLLAGRQSSRSPESSESSESPTSLSSSTPYPLDTVDRYISSMEDEPPLDSSSSAPFLLRR